MTAVDALLVSTSQHLLLVARGDVRIVHSGAGLYFGIDQLDGRTYVACHHQVLRDPTVDELEAQDGSILVLDGELREVAQLRSPDLRLRQPHGIAAIDGRIWVTATYDDLVAIVDPTTGRWERWEPARGAGPAKPTHDDRFHYNAIRAVGGDELQLLAHSYGHSQVLTFGRADLDLRRVDEVGVGAHDLFDLGGRTVVASSLEGALRSSDGWVRRVGGMPRGVAWDGDVLVVGCSELSERESRHRTDGRLRWLGPDGAIVRDLVLPATGQVLDLAATRVARATLDALAPLASAVDHTGLDVPCYEVPRSFPPLRFGEWHEGEAAQQWIAARRASFPIVVNPEDRWIELELVSHRPGPMSVSSTLDGHPLGSTSWSGPGTQRTRFALGPHVGEIGGVHPSGRDATLTFEVPDLWSPAGDVRRLGIGLRSIRVG